MDYLEQLVQNMDPADRARLESGRYLQLLEAALPPKTHPRYRAWRTHALSGIERGRVLLEIVARFSREIREARMLDFGCGDGGLAVAFARAGARVTAIDEDPGRVARTRALAEDFGQEVDVRQDREFGAGLPAQSFDIIVCNDVIEHVDPFSRLARSHARLLKPEGVLNLNPPNRFSLRLLRADPHFGLFGLSLAGPRLGAFYVTRVRKRSEGYGLNRLLGWREVHQIYRRVGIEFYCYSNDRIRDKLGTLATSSPRLGQLAKLLPQSLVVPLIRTLIVGEWIMIGRREGKGSDPNNT